MWGLLTSPQMRADYRQIISYFSYISKGFRSKQAGALQVVVSSSINCSILAIHSVQTQHQAFKFLLTQRGCSVQCLAGDSCRLLSNHRSVLLRTPGGKGNRKLKTMTGATERFSPGNCTPTTWKNKPKKSTQTTSTAVWRGWSASTAQCHLIKIVCLGTIFKSLF